MNTMETDTDNNNKHLKTIDARRRLVCSRIKPSSFTIHRRIRLQFEVPLHFP